MESLNKVRLNPSLRRHLWPAITTSSRRRTEQIPLQVVDQAKELIGQYTGKPHSPPPKPRERAPASPINLVAARPTCSSSIRSRIQAQPPNKTRTLPPTRQVLLRLRSSVIRPMRSMDSARPEALPRSNTTPVCREVSTLKGELKVQVWSVSRGTSQVGQEQGQSRQTRNETDPPISPPCPATKGRLTARLDETQPGPLMVAPTTLPTSELGSCPGARRKIVTDLRRYSVNSTDPRACPVAAPSPRHSSPHGVVLYNGAEYVRGLRAIRLYGAKRIRFEKLILEKPETTQAKLMRSSLP